MLVDLVGDDGVVTPPAVDDAALEAVVAVRVAVVVATVLRADGGDGLVTDGPYPEGKEHIGGFWIIRAPDLDAALDWARKATAACKLPVEVRPMVDLAEG